MGGCGIGRLVMLSVKRWGKKWKKTTKKMVKRMIMRATSSAEKDVSFIIYYTRHNRGSEKLEERIRNVRLIIESIMGKRKERRVNVMCSGPE